MEQNRMTGFVECGDTLFLLRDHAALFLRADSHLHKRLLDVRLCNIRTVFLRCDNSRLIQKILKIRAGKARSRLCDLF